MYIVTGYSTTRYESSLFEPVPFNVVDNAIKTGVQRFIDFVADQCGLDINPGDDEILDIEDNFEPTGTFDGCTVPLTDGKVSVKDLREALLKERQLYFYAATKDYANYFIDIDINKVDTPTDTEE